MQFNHPKKFNCAERGCEQIYTKFIKKFEYYIVLRTAQTLFQNNIIHNWVRKIQGPF